MSMIRRICEFTFQRKKTDRSVLGLKIPTVVTEHECIDSCNINMTLIGSNILAGKFQAGLSEGIQLNLHLENNR